MMNDCLLVERLFPYRSIVGLQELLNSGAGKAVANSDGKEDSKDHLCVFFAVTVVFFFFFFFHFFFRKGHIFSQTINKYMIRT